MEFWGPGHRWGEAHGIPVHSVFRDPRAPSFWHLFSDDAPIRLQDDPRGLQNGPRHAKTGFFEPTWAHVGANMGPCWH